MTFAVQANGHKIETVESLGTPEKMSVLQQAFQEKHGAQCGFCTPGMLISARALLNRNPHPSEQDVVEALVGNLCRCTGYSRIIESVQAAAGLP